MKKTIFLSLVFFCILNISTYAEETNNAAGNFTITQNGAPIQGHYSIMPAAPANIVLQLSPSAEFTLNAHIVDQSGKELIKIDAVTVHRRYANSIDISALSVGDYFIEIKSENESETLKIPFSKS